MSRPEMLTRGQMRRLSGISATLRCYRGIVWITEEGTPDDLLLTAGESHPIAAQGVTLIEAIEPAVLQLEVVHQAIARAL